LFGQSQVLTFSSAVFWAHMFGHTQVRTWAVSAASWAQMLGQTQVLTWETWTASCEQTLGQTQGLTWALSCEGWLKGLRATIRIISNMGFLL